jgi:hypothetical protein
MEKVLLCKHPQVQRVLQEDMMGVFVCNSGGTLLYSFEVDSSLDVDLISQFVAALNIFGSENLGQIKRILIEGLNVELSIVTRHNLIAIVFFRPNMVEDYLDEEIIKALDMSYKEFKESLKKNKTNQFIYSKFDECMCILIHDYLIRVGLLDEKELCENRCKYFDIDDDELSSYKSV